MKLIETIEELEGHYGAVSTPARNKVLPRITPLYRAYIEASPFCALASVGPEGLDCSPRGDAGAVVRIETPRRLSIPDRRGNNRIDSLRNIVRDPRVALLFLIPGSGTTLRVNGRAHISVDPDLLASFAVEGKAPRSVILVDVERVYFQCARAIVRSRLWEPDARRDPAGLPTPGEILSEVSNAREGGPAYDADWPERARKTLW